MNGFTEHQLLGAFLAVLVVLLAARGMAEISRRLRQPEVLGELLGGFIIGPSVLGALFPGAFHLLFGNAAVSLALQWMSWIGAILLLMIAGLEADLAILRQKVVPGLLAAAGAIGASIGVGTFFGTRLFGLDPTSAFFLGLVLSVTAVSVVAKLLIEREALRRDYAQVLLAAGIAGEVLVWPLISIVSSVQHKGNPWVAGLRATGLAALFFVFMFTLGRRFTYWSMRRVADATGIPNGELSLILVLLLASAAITTVLGLHPLLGAFVFGVLLGKAPRATVPLKERIQSLTIALFAPIFFGLAGMRVNLFNLRGRGSLEAIVVLLVFAGLAKVLLGFAGALLGRLPAWEAATVGVGLNLKGGTDVVVAIVGTELLLLSSDLYTTYAVVAILTVIATPPLMNWLAGKTRPGEVELKRLNREEARKLAYLADRERVLVPLEPALMPALSARIVAAIATAKHLEGELFDVTEIALESQTPQPATKTQAGSTPIEINEPHESVVEASTALAQAATLDRVEVARIASSPEQVLETLETAAASQHLVAIGAARAFGEMSLSFGPMQDRILREVSTDVLLAVHPDADFPKPRRILVPVTGLTHSFDAADVRRLHRQRLRRRGRSSRRHGPAPRPAVLARTQAPRPPPGRLHRHPRGQKTHVAPRRPPRRVRRPLRPPGRSHRRRAQTWRLRPPRSRQCPALQHQRHLSRQHRRASASGRPHPPRPAHLTRGRGLHALSRLPSYLVPSPHLPPHLQTRYTLPMKYLIALLAAAGIFVSVLALRVHLQDPAQAPPCAVTEKFDCGAVNHSRYAVFPARTLDEVPASHKVHIPIATIGIVGYALIAAAALAGQLLLTFELAQIGLFFALMLTYLEAFVIQKWCIYCLWSQGIIASIVLLTAATLAFRWYTARRARAATPTVAHPAQLV